MALEEDNSVFPEFQNTLIYAFILLIPACDLGFSDVSVYTTQYVIVLQRVSQQL